MEDTMLLSKAELNLGNLAPKEESRYTLQSIAVEKDCTVTTNGHYLVTVTHGALADVDYPVTNGLEHVTVNGKPKLIHRDAAIAALKALPRKTTIPILGNAALGADGKLYVNDLENVQAFGKEVTGQFPNWQAVMPKPDDKPIVKIGLASGYLRLLADYIDKYGVDGPAGGPTITMTVYAADKAIKMEAKTPDGQNITAVLMPVRLT